MNLTINENPVYKNNILLFLYDLIMNKLTKSLLSISTVLITIQILLKTFSNLVFSTNSLFYFFILIIIFILPIVFNNVEKKFCFLIKNYKNKFLGSLFLISILSGWFYLNLSNLEFLVWVYFWFSILYIFETRITALIALTVLSFIPIQLILENKTVAEELAIFVYYFLIIIVFTEIRGLFLNPSNKDFI